MPDLVKIDIEGAEMLALRGAKKMLSSGMPTLLIEVHSEELSARSVSRLLETPGYRFYQLWGNRSRTGRMSDS